MRTGRFLSFFIVLLACYASFATAPPKKDTPAAVEKIKPWQAEREWQSANGQFKTIARYVGEIDVAVILKKRDGKLVEVKKGLLSESDLAFLGKFEFVVNSVETPKPSTETGGTKLIGLDGQPGLRSNRQQSTAEPPKETESILGNWSGSISGMACLVSLYKRGGVYSMKTTFSEDGSSLFEPLKRTKYKSETRYYIVNDPGNCYYVVNKYGDLEVKDEEGVGLKFFKKPGQIFKD